VFTTGVFHGPGGKTLALVTNRDYKNERRARVEVTGNPAVERFDSGTRSWSDFSDEKLPPGGGVLLRW
jgi:hypothetical protein